MTPSNDIYRVAVRREARRRYPGEFSRKKKAQRVHFKKKEKKKAQRAALTVLTLALSFYEKSAPKGKKSPRLGHRLMQGAPTSPTTVNHRRVPTNRQQAYLL